MRGGREEPSRTEKKGAELKVLKISRGWGFDQVLDEAFICMM